MIEKKQIVQFDIQNRTDCGINVPVYKLNVFSINATTKYSWDITGWYLCGYSSIEINGVTIIMTYQATSLIGFLTALNALGYGFFCSETVGAETYIITYDDTNIYGDLEICAASQTCLGYDMTDSSAACLDAVNCGG